VTQVCGDLAVVGEHLVRPDGDPQEGRRALDRRRCRRDRRGRTRRNDCNEEGQATAHWWNLPMSSRR
jgi:hypothetical protein